MNIGHVCKRMVISIRDTADIVEAAQLMRNQHVGFLVVFKDGDQWKHPIGVLTDRDIALEVVAREVGPHEVTVGDVMTPDPVIASENGDVGELLQAMRIAGIRRAPVVDARGTLTGIVAMDDAIDLVAGSLCDISGSVKSEQRQEWRSRPHVAHT
jgi:predicted transcriptional regulator